MMKITKARLTEILKEELEAINIEEIAAMPVVGQGGQDLTDSDVQFAIKFISDQIEELDSKVGDLADVSVMNRDKIKTLKYVLLKMIEKHDLREEKA